MPELHTAYPVGTRIRVTSYEGWDGEMEGPGVNYVGLTGTVCGARLEFLSVLLDDDPTPEAIYDIVRSFGIEPAFLILPEELVVIND